MKSTTLNSQVHLYVDFLKSNFCERIFLIIFSVTLSFLGLPVL